MFFNINFSVFVSNQFSADQLAVIDHLVNYTNLRCAEWEEVQTWWVAGSEVTILLTSEYGGEEAFVWEVTTDHRLIIEIQEGEEDYEWVPHPTQENLVHYSCTCEKMNETLYLTKNLAQVALRAYKQEERKFPFLSKGKPLFQ